MQNYFETHDFCFPGVALGRKQLNLYVTQGKPIREGTLINVIG